MLFRETTIGEAPILISDGNYSSKYPKKSEFKQNGVPFISANNFSAGTIISENMKYISPELHRSLRKGHLYSGDVLLVTRGNGIGNTAFVQPSFKDANINAQLVLLRADNEHLEKRYLYYLISSPDFFKLVKLYSSGSAQPQLPIGVLKQIPIRYHEDRDVQRRIAFVIGSYDDLIENNVRRIKILEEMSRRLYREWFVHFRFPGHERALMVDSTLGKIPGGWEVKPLVECLSVLETGSRPKGGVAEIVQGIPSIGAEHVLGAGKYDYSRTKYIPQRFFDNMNKGILADRDVLVYKDGGKPGDFQPHISIVGEGFPFKVMTINSHVYRLRTNGFISQEFLYYHLSSEEMLEWMHLHGTGAAVPSIARRDLMQLPMIQPSQDLVDRFGQVAEDHISQMLILAKKSYILQQTRDLLLTRLISGELDVSELDIKIEGYEK